jgi:hypothetical protein
MGEGREEKRELKENTGQTAGARDRRFRILSTASFLARRWRTYRQQHQRAEA